MSVSAHFNDYTVHVTYTGDRASPLDPKNFDCHVVKLTNTFTKTNSHMNVWRPQVNDPSAALYTFYSLLQSAMFGALDPEEFCACMGIEPKHFDKGDTKVMFHNHRTNAARMAPIINTREELVNTTKMLARHLGVDRNKG